jgi:hypothetical protein
MVVYSLWIEVPRHEIERRAGKASFLHKPRRSAISEYVRSIPQRLSDGHAKKNWQISHHRLVEQLRRRDGFGFAWDAMERIKSSYSPSKQALHEAELSERDPM